MKCYIIQPLVGSNKLPYLTKHDGRGGCRRPLSLSH